MNEHQHPRDSDDLSDLLRSWQIDERDDELLAKRVWRRIDAGQAGRQSDALKWLLTLFAKPVAACTAVALCAAAGGLIAANGHYRQREARLDRLASEYVRSIDPVRMTSDARHGGM